MLDDSKDFLIQLLFIVFGNIFINLCVNIILKHTIKIHKPLPFPNTNDCRIYSKNVERQEDIIFISVK